MQLERLAAGACAISSSDACRERCALRVGVGRALVDAHRRAPLAAVARAARRPCVSTSASSTASTWSTSCASNSRSVARAVRGARAGEEVRVARRDDRRRCTQLARVAVVGVQAVALPRVVTEHDVGPGGRGSPRRPARDGRRGRRRARRRPRRGSGRRRRRARAAAARCSSLAGGDERGEVVVGIPGALRAVGEHEQVARRRPRRAHLRERRAAPELDVVGMRADREDPRRAARRRVDGHGRARLDDRGQRRRGRRGRRRRTEVGVAHDAQPEPEPACLGRRGGGTSPGRRRTRKRRVGGTESTGVPSSRWQGTSATTGCAPSRASRARSCACGRSACATTHAGAPAARRWSRRRRRRASSEPGSSSTSTREVARPGAHVGIRRHHDDRQRRRRRATHLLGPSAGRAPRARRGRATSARRALPSAKARIGDRPRPDAASRGTASGNIAARMLPSVESADVRGRDRRRLVGHHRRRDHERARADHAVGPRPRAGRRRSTSGTRTRSYLAGHRAARRAARHHRPRRPRAPAPTWW